MIENKCISSFAVNNGDVDTEYVQFTSCIALQHITKYNTSI